MLDSTQIPSYAVWWPCVTKLILGNEHNHNQSGRSPNVVAFFSANNFSSHILELLQLHDTIQIKWNYAWIHYNIAIRSHFMIYKMCKISFLQLNLVAFSSYTVNIHLEKWLMRCNTKHAIWWDLYNTYLYFASNIWVPIFRTVQVNKW